MTRQWRTAILLVSLALAGCGGGGLNLGGTKPSDDESGFKDRYLVARNHLEAGDFAVAVRSYRALSREYDGSALSPRLSLELAHALLRSGAYEEAAAVARGVSARAEGASRGMALAVFGSAQHELARRKIAAGTPAGPELLAAAEALDEALADYPELDKGGAMTRRRDMIAAAMPGN